MAEIKSSEVPVLSLNVDAENEGPSVSLARIYSLRLRLRLFPSALRHA